MCFFSLVEVENLLGQKDYKKTKRTKIALITSNILHFYLQLKSETTCNKICWFLIKNKNRKWNIIWTFLFYFLLFSVCWLPWQDCVSVLLIWVDIVICIQSSFLTWTIRCVKWYSHHDSKYWSQFLVLLLVLSKTS